MKNFSLFECLNLLKYSKILTSFHILKDLEKESEIIAFSKVKIFFEVIGSTLITLKSVLKNFNF